ncbi:hypothetical protein HDU79_009893 [Rhizoclosmatium sp. JEL0117]|nr:hypothetical protein HDU79_009893 [Rhizoclosmatium sp. JEL0117]
MTSANQTYTVLVTVREGRHFHAGGLFNPATTKLYIQCRFNNEILTTDPTPFSHDPVWDTDLAWDIQHKPLAFLRTQRAKLKIVCFAIDNRNKRTQVGYVMLDLRTASSTANPKWNADPDVEKDAAWGWYPLVNVLSGTNVKTVFRPELKLAFSVAVKTHEHPTSNPSQSWDRVAQLPTQKSLQSLKKMRNASSPKPVLLTSPKAIRVQLFPDSGRTSPVQIQQNQNQTLFTTSSGIPIELTPTGCYQIGFNGPNWLLNFTIAFAENLTLLAPPTKSDKGETSSEDEEALAGYYFSYSFLGNTITTTPFQDLEKPIFPSERISFRIRASDQDLAQFLTDVEVLVVCLCDATKDGAVLGFSEVAFAGIMEEGAEDDGGIGVISASVGGAGGGGAGSGALTSRPQSPDADRVFRSSTTRSVMTRKKESRVLEKVVPFYDARRELPVSAEGKVAGLGISVMVTPDLQTDLVEAESGGPQQALLGEEEPVHDDAENLKEAEEYGEQEFEEYDQVDTVNSPKMVQRRALSPERMESPDLYTDVPQPQTQPAQLKPVERPVPAQRVQQQQSQAAQDAQFTPQPIVKGNPWHQYRFSIDLRSLRGLDPAHGPVFLRYTYLPFGSTAPISTHPPVKPTTPNATSSTNPQPQSTLEMPHSFCAFEFVMGQERLLTYLEAVPLTIELWCLPDKYSKEVRIGLATVDLSIVTTKELKQLTDPTPVTLQSTDVQVPIVASTPADPTSPTKRDKIVKIADLRIVLSLEDFGPLQDSELLAQQIPSHSATPLPTASFQEHQQNDGYSHLPRGPSPTFTKTTQLPPPSSPTPSTTTSSLHETQEYRAALEIALWKKEQMHKFKQHLHSLEQNLLNRLTTEFQTRDAERTRLVQQRVTSLEVLESTAREVLQGLEKREAGVSKAEEDLRRRREEVERYFARKEEEVGDVSRRLSEEFRARVELERVKTLEAEAGRVRAVRERDEWEGKFRKLEGEFEVFRGRVMEGKVGGFGVTPVEVGEAAVSAIKRELGNVMAANAATERRAEALEASKRHYKAQWVRALRDLAKVKKQLQGEIEDRLRRSQKELDSVKLRLLAKEEMGSMENERKVVEGMKREIASLKAGAGAIREERVDKVMSMEARFAAEGGSSATAPLQESQKQNLDPRILAEVDRLVKERDSLVNTGIYNREDRLIRELDTRIGNLLRARA